MSMIGILSGLGRGIFVVSHKSAVNLFLHQLACPVGQLSGGDLLVELSISDGSATAMGWCVSGQHMISEVRGRS